MKCAASNRVCRKPLVSGRVRRTRPATRRPAWSCSVSTGIPGAHRRGHRDLAQVTTLRRARLEPQHLVEGGEVVLRQLLRAERRLADDEVQVGVPVDPELDLAALDLGHGLGNIHRHGAGLGVRHQAARAQDAAEPADLAHQVRRRDDGVEIEVASHDLLDQLVGADLVGAGRLRGLGPVTGGEHQHAGGLAGTVRQVHRAADHLIGLAGIDPEPGRDLDGLVELGLGSGLCGLDGLERRVEPLRLDRGRGGRVCLAALHGSGSFHQFLVRRAALRPSQVLAC